MLARVRFCSSLATCLCACLCSPRARVWRCELCACVFPMLLSLRVRVRALTCACACRAFATRAISIACACVGYAPASWRCARVYVAATYTHLALARCAFNPPRPATTTPYSFQSAHVRVRAHGPLALLSAGACVSSPLRPMPVAHPPTTTTQPLSHFPSPSSPPALLFVLSWSGCQPFDPQSNPRVFSMQAEMLWWYSK